MKKLLLLLAMVAVFLPGFAYSQEIQRPVRVVGDWCEYESQGVGVAKDRQEVVEVAPDGGYTIKRTNERGEELSVYNASGENVKLGNRDIRRISSSRAPYPISVTSIGRETKYSWPHSRRPGISVELTRVTKSVDRETVTVPAGTFDTLRVVRVTNYQFHDGSYSNQMVDTVWYSLDPKNKFPVKFNFIDYGAKNSAIERILSKCGSAH
jgi:hypothetical protein